MGIAECNRAIERLTQGMIAISSVTKYSNIKLEKPKRIKIYSRYSIISTTNSYPR